MAASFSLRASSMQGLIIFCMFVKKRFRLQQHPISFFN